MLKPKLKKCRVCKKEFPLYHSTQIVCSTFCAIGYARKQKKKKEVEKRRIEKRDRKARLDKLKTVTQWSDEAQKVFNQYIRLRDQYLPCVSCSRPNDGSHQRHASHFKNVKTHKQLRFNTYNVHASCAQCNSMESGNKLEYRERLIKRIGLDKVDQLESNQELANRDIEYIKRVKKVFAKKVRLYKRKFR